VAEPLVESVPTVIVKLALVDPAETVADPGTVNSGLLLDKLTTTPPLGAAAESVTPHEVDVFEPRMEGHSEKPVTVGKGAATINPKLFDVTPLSDAVMFAEPTPTPAANPVPLIVAAPVLEELHVTWLVILAVELLLYVPVAVHWVVAPVVIEADPQVTAIDVSVGEAAACSWIVKLWEVLL
jgi:hypothetical protein